MVGLLYLWFVLALLVAQPLILGSTAQLSRLGFPLKFGRGVMVGTLVIALHPRVRAGVLAMPLQ